MKHTRKRLWAVALLWLMLGGCDELQGTQEVKELSYAEIVDGSDHFPGFLDMYRDRNTGEVYLSLPPDQLGIEFIYAARYLDGIADTWTSRGVHADAVILSLRRRFQRVEFIKSNVNFYHDPASAIARAADANRQPAVLAVAEIAAEDPHTGRILANIDPVVLSEALTQITPAADPDEEAAKQHFAPGELNIDKSSVQDLRSYPRNSQLTVNYVFENPAPWLSPGASSADPRIVTIVLQHNFLAMPDEGFEPRFADPRVGYFASPVTDMTSFSATPWRDPIQRWRLKKKNPAADVSDPVQPITFWLENSTPRAFRDEVEAGILAWNAAFEQAGFSNAIDVKVQPDDADWDAEDIRYNVVRWTASTESPWGGYGPAFVNPRTGEVVGSDIMLEFGWLQTYNRWDRQYVEGPVREHRARRKHCSLGARRAHQLALASLVTNEGVNEESELLRRSLIDLVMHEVGHVLGLYHNFAASTYLDFEQLQDRALTEKVGLASSVMDYLSPNLAPPGGEQGVYFSDEVGVYDRWAIEYGYSEALGDPEAESARLETILSRSTQPGHFFAEDAEAMNDSSLGMDPRVLLFDHGSNPLAVAGGMIALTYATEPTVLTRLAKDNANWQEIHDAYLRLTSELGYQAMVAARWVGGVYVDKSVQGQQGAGTPLEPVPRALQEEAMMLLHEQIFAPEAFGFSAGFYRHLQQARRGERFWEEPQAAQLHERVLEQQKLALDHLLHPTVMQRITDSELYGNDYSLTDVMNDLSDAVFEADLGSSVNTLRQQLQAEYVRQLLALIAEGSDTEHTAVARSAAMGQVLRVREMLTGRPAVDQATQAHTAMLLLQIERVLSP